MIRKNANWMDLLHERILESLRDNGPATLSLMAVSKGVQGAEGEIISCLEDLERVGLISEDCKGRYRLIEPGLDYLDGNLDLADSMVTYTFELRMIAEIERTLRELEDCGNCAKIWSPENAR